MAGLIDSIRYGRVVHAAAGQAMPAYRLAQWIALGASAEETRNPRFTREMCDCARTVFARHNSFYLHASAPDAGYESEAAEFLMILIAYAQGKRGEPWNPGAAHELVVELLGLLHRKPQEFTARHQPLIDQMRSEVREYFVGTCLPAIP